LFEAVFEEGNGVNSWAMRWLDRFWPIGDFVWKTWLPRVIVALRNVCAGANRNISSPCYLERVAYITSSPASIIRDRGNPDQLNCGPIEYHGQRAQIVDIASQIRIEM
jgi:hypothetical protein